jgi:uncharacterized protein (DUF2132 family)
MNSTGSESSHDAPSSSAPVPRSKDPLHGVTLEKLLTDLVEYYGWPELGRRIDIRCFNFDPSIKSSLQFLRKTPWARTKVEELYIRSKDRLKPRRDSPAAGRDRAP